MLLQGHLKVGVNRCNIDIARSLSSSIAANVNNKASLESAPPPVVVAQQLKKIKYFKVYRWDPQQKQKPYMVRLMIYY